MESREAEKRWREEASDAVISFAIQPNLAMEGEEDGTDFRPTFVKRSRPKAPGAKLSSTGIRDAAATGSGSKASSSSANAARVEARGGQGDESDEEEGFAVRRSSTARSRPSGNAIASSSKPRPKSKIQSKELSFGDGEDGEDEELPAIAVKARPKGQTSRSALVLPSNLDQASIAPTQSLPMPAGDDVAEPPTSHYSSEGLAALKASNRSRTRNEDLDGAVDEDGNSILLSGDNMSAAGSGTGPTAFRTMPDPSATDAGALGSGDPSSTLKFFGSDHLDASEGNVPSQSVIEAAKERRRRAAAGNAMGAEDFVSLEDRSGRESPSSAVQKYDGRQRQRGDEQVTASLQREEDEVGSGEDEFAEFTGAKERIDLDAGRRKKEERRRRVEQAEQVLPSNDQDVDGGSDNSDDDAFERAQMERLGGMFSGRAARQHREKSPYRPAPLPPIAPLPSIGGVSHDLQSRLDELQSDIRNHEAIVEDATRTFAQLDEEEAQNKEAVSSWSEREGWAREFTTFIESLAVLMEDKWPTLERIEEEYMVVVSEKRRITQQRRAKEMEDELSLFWGVPQLSLMPSQRRDPQSNAEAMDTDASEGALGQQEESSPTEDGDAASAIRSDRRNAGEVPANQAAAVLREYRLSSPDHAGYVEAVAPLRQRLDQVLDSVKAPEYRWPDAKIEKQGDNAAANGSAKHPSSVHTRFLDWRRRYPDDYSNAWGGLALAGIWEFWAKRELTFWEPFDGASRQDIESSHSLLTLQHYVEESMAVGHEGDSGAAAIGGDDEAVGTLVNSTFIPRVMAMADRSYDPWSTAQTSRALALCGQVADFTPRSGVRFQSVVDSFLKVFEHTVTRIDKILSSSPAIPPPGFHPLSIPARLAFTTRLVAPPIAGQTTQSLLFNLLRWSKLASAGSNVGSLSNNARMLDSLVDVLLSKVGCELLRQNAETGGRAMAAGILEAVTRYDVRVQADVRGRLQAIASPS